MDTNHVATRGLLAVVVALLAAPATAADVGTTITDFEPDWGTFRPLAPGSDNWPTTWAASGSVYAAWGDGDGFGNVRVSLGFARLSGASARTINGTNLPGNAPKGKSYGVLALGKTLYAWISPGSNAANYEEARLYAAPLGTNQWKAATWAFTKDDAAHLILPTFLQAGKGYAEVKDYIYVYAARYDPKIPGQLSIQGASGNGEIALLRASKKSDLLARDSWEFYAGDAGWSKDPNQLVPVITDKNGVGWTVSAAYDPGLKLYLVATEHGTSFASQLTLLESANPEGPWHTAAYTTLADPQARVDTKAFYYDFLPNSFSKDGKRFTLVFTGTGNADALNLVDGSFTTAGGGGGNGGGGGGNGNGGGGNGGGGNGNGGGGNGNSNGSGGSGSSGTGCNTGTTSSNTNQTSNSGSSGNTGGTSSNTGGTSGNTQGNVGTVSTNVGAGTGDTGTSTDTGCTGDGTDQSSDTISTFAGSGSSGSTSGQTTGQQGSQINTQQGSQSPGSGSASFSLDPRSFRRDTDTGAGAPPDETGCDTGGTRLLTPRADRAGGTREVKGKGDTAVAEAGQVVADAAPEEACGQRKGHPPDPADAQPPALHGQM